MRSDSSDLEKQCGALLVVGFAGTALPDTLRSALTEQRRGGAIVFSRNLQVDAQGGLDVEALVRLNASVLDASPELPPLIAVDQEGGRVARLKAPVLRLPPARALGVLDTAVLEELARALGRQLVALGFNMDFAPVLDVDSNPANPVIGDRSFATTPEAVARAALAFVRGFRSVGLLTCGKHFPGHGDTELDSHHALAHVRHPRQRLFEMELSPFKRAIDEGIDALMTAHVVFDALDALVPATLSRPILQDLLRTQLGYDGVCISDDLYMRGVSPSGGADASEVARLAVAAVEAGCDMLLFAHDGAAVDAAFEALVERSKRDSAFAARVHDAFRRVALLRRLVPPRPERDMRELQQRLLVDERTKSLLAYI